MATVLFYDDLMVNPYGCKELVHMCPHDTDLQGPDEAVTVYSVIGIPQVKED